MSNALALTEIARLPAASDNAAIATRRIEAGTRVISDSGEFDISATVLEGHRFAVTPIATGQPILSWGLPFGLALHDIAPGEYLCNDKVLGELRHRRLDFPVPPKANFRDHRIAFSLDEASFRPAQQTPLVAKPCTFDGFARTGGRGVGTRNFIVVLGTSSRTASYARLLAERFRDVPLKFPNLDRVVPVAHTEGGGPAQPNNLDFTLRTLAGFMVHPNVAAVLAVDFGNEPVNNATLRDYLLKHRYPLDALPHRFLSVHGGFEASLTEGEGIVRSWLDMANSFTRTSQPLAHLRVGLQCGGSDAFSGVSANPLLGWVSREIIRHGGSANLAETSELIGAEPYVLAKVRDLDTARKFLRQAERFQEWAGWHGHSAEGNPSGGNLYRGLYNIVVKSIGAARKKDPDTRLDYCIEYSEPMTAPGYYFMDSPGNDLESIAGQVGAGCNLIAFTTGNGSITNFPFVPTIKIVTTTGRYEMLRKEMDFNAGTYLTGTPMDELGRELFDYTLRIISGQRSVGEKAGHSQVQLWRDWAQTDASKLKELEHAARPTGEPLNVNWSAEHCSAGLDVQRVLAERCSALRRASVGLIVPTSLCAGQISQMIATRLNADLKVAGLDAGVARRAADLTLRSLSPRPSPAGRGSDEGRALKHTSASDQAEGQGAVLPLPAGEDRGEGESVENTLADGHPKAPITRFVALPHTEGCGNSRGDSEILYQRTMTSYLRHPSVAKALLLEHGCEKTHNDEMRAFMAEHGVDASQLGFASIQLDGGIDAVTKKVVNWFQRDESQPCDMGSAPASGAVADVPSATQDDLNRPKSTDEGVGRHTRGRVCSPEGMALRLGLAFEGELPPVVAGAFASLAVAVLEQGGTVVMPFLPAGGKRLGEQLGIPAAARPTLAYGQFAELAGLHLMDAPTRHFVETLTGLGATGVEVIVAYVGDALAQSHPLVPVLQISTAPLADVDCVADPGASSQSLTKVLVERILQTIAGEYRPKAMALGNVDFQVTRGLVGVSL